MKLREEELEKRRREIMQNAEEEAGQLSANSSKEVEFVK